MAESLGALLETCLEAEESTQSITVDHTPISNERARRHKCRSKFSPWQHNTRRLVHGVLEPCALNDSKHFRTTVRR